MASDPTAAKGARRPVHVGKYEVVAHVATGGMGAVYRARDTTNGREVALKVLNPEMAAKPAMLERFRREFHAAERLAHDNIVRVYDFDHVKDTWFLAMEFVDGIDLHDYVKRKGLLDPEEARQIIVQGCRALRHAYDQDVVHRDIKPSNFLVTKKAGRLLIKLTDMGLARTVDEDLFRVTRAGTTVGTLDYMAPEQARDSGSADIRSDLYSLGATWYHLLTGRCPFSAGGLTERLYKLMNDPPPDARDLNPLVSDQTWEVLERLLAKDPRDRYQTPAGLLEDLAVLEGKAASAPGAPRRPPPTKISQSPKKSIGPTRGPARAETSMPGKAPATAIRRPQKNYTTLLIGSSIALIVSGIVLAIALTRERHRPRADSTRDKPPAAEPDPDPGQKPRASPADGGKKKEKPGPVAPAGPRWPALYKPAAPIDAAALRTVFQKPWAGRPAPAEGLVVRVARVPAGVPAPAYPSLAAACAAAPADRPLVIEVHDNGPLFETSALREGRDLTVRAGEGYRPLLVWDVRRTLAERRAAEKEAAGPPLLLGVRGGALRLEGLDVVVPWPETEGGPATLLEARDGDLDVRNCTFSAAGRPRDGLTLARLSGPGPPNVRCRFTRCCARGAALTALDLDCRGGEVLLDGCLLVGGEPPLLRVHSDGTRGASVRAVRSTLVCGRTLLELSATDGTLSPRFRWFGWDALLSRSSRQAGGELLALRGGADADRVKWSAHNCLYAGWQTLLAGPRPVRGDERNAWHERWGRAEGDELAQAPWPAQDFTEPATLPAATFEPGGAVAFAASVDPDKPLGCDLPALPPLPNGWPALVLGRAVETPRPLDEAGAPAIPAGTPGDGLYHGGRIDLARGDVGEEIAGIQRRQKLGPVVVLHLAGKGEYHCSPIRVKGVKLVLYFEPPAKGDEPPALRAGGVRDAAALVEIDSGGLDVIGGTLRGPDAGGPGVRHLVKVRGGEARLYRTRLEVPPDSAAPGFRSVVLLEGPADGVSGCSLNECVLVSARTGVLVEGVGARLLVRQSLLAAGAEALDVRPGDGCRGRANVACLLENVTIAAREAVLHLGDAVRAGRVEDPVVVRARRCAFLNPFPGRPSKAGLLLFDGKALPRGLLAWQDEDNSFDRRLFFAAAPTRAVPEKAEGYGSWLRLWGTRAVPARRLELRPARVFDRRRWHLERLAVPPGCGADLARLGIGAKKPGRPGG
jgi:serine/threonine-protein kinase